MSKLTDSEWLVLSTLANGYVHELHTEEPQYRDEVESLIQYADAWSLKKLKLMLGSLNHRPMTMVLTGNTKLVVEMNDSELSQLAIRFSNSSIVLLRQFSALVEAIATQCLYRLNKEFRRKFCHDYGTHPQLSKARSEKHLRKVWEVPIVSIPQSLQADVPPTINTEIAIIGTGSSAMVAAYLLSSQGFRVLLIERGKQVTHANSATEDAVRDKQAFLNEGYVFTTDASVVTFAGATLGGGGAVNWSCSIPTPQYVREEWVRNGFPLAGDPLFDEGFQAVQNVMKLTRPAQHSFSNEVIYAGATKLGYPVEETLQNTGKHQMNTGFVEFGERRGAEEGGIAEWLRFAVQNGAQVLTEAEVVNIRHNRGRASGLDVMVSRSGRKFLLHVTSKRVVCAGGAISTPHLLLQSRFRNKHIGHGLKLHPGVVAFGEFDQDVNYRNDTIMTTVCSEGRNQDGEGHGTLIEAIHNRSNFLLYFLPWRNPQDWQDKAHSIKQTSALIALARTKGGGQVSYSITQPETAKVDYTPNAGDLELLKQGLLVSANLLYIQGAKRIFVSNNHVPDFESNKPTTERSIWDPDYQHWRRILSSIRFEPHTTRIGTAHQMASCRINEKGSRYGAVDARGRLYECPNVHVIDTSVFPSASGVNPMISCMTVAYGLTKYMIEDLRKCKIKL